MHIQYQLILLQILKCLIPVNQASRMTYQHSLLHRGICICINAHILSGHLDRPGLPLKGKFRRQKAGNIFLAFFMLSAFMGIAYWDRPTFIPTSDYTDAELAAMNSQYQDYIASFETGEGGKILPNKSRTSAMAASSVASAQKNREDGSLSRMESYLVDAETVIKRMTDIINAIDNFEPLASNISEAEREQRSSQALAINNNAVALNKKVLGLFHPHESSEAHTELIQASECVRLAAYALYSYTLQENPEQQLILYRQSRDQIAQMKIYLKRFWNATEVLQSNNQQQTEQ